MSPDSSLTEADQGKQVINSTGDEIGRVVEVKGGDAYVNPSPGVTDSIKTKLGWGDRQSEETYRLDSSHINTVTDDEVRVDL